MKKVLQGFLLLLFLVASQAYAQNRTVTGVVTGKDDGLPLPGVSVIVQGTKIGTQTSADGTYSIKLPDNNSTLVFSFIGFNTQTITVTGNRANVALAGSASQLNEVVVVGYGTQERKDVTGSIGSVKGSQLVDQPVASFDQALAGKVTGVQVTVPSGILGAAPVIRIRGTNSITGGADPLYVVDGIPIITGNQSGITQNNPLGDINPNDIQSIDVLKDGASTAIYGSRGSNGVVIITTKRGVLGKPRISYDSWFASSQPSKRFKLLDASQFITIANEKLTNAGSVAAAFPTYDASGKLINTNWQNVVFNNSAFQQNHAFSISGATEQTNYFFSLGYADFDGIINSNNQRKYQYRGKVEQKAFNNRVTFGVNTSLSYINNNGLNTGVNALSGNVGNAIRLLPNVPVFNADGSYNLSSLNSLGRGTNGTNLRDIDDNYTNIKYIIDHNIYNNQNTTFNGDAFANINIVKGLDFRTQVGTNALFGEDYEYLDPGHGDGAGSTRGYEFQQYIPQFRYNWINTLSYNTLIGDHNISAVAGIEYQKSRYRSFYASGSQISSTFFGGQNIISNSLTQSTFGIGGAVSENAYKSYFGRINYSFKDRYLLGVTYRADAISSLPVGKQFAYLPGASLGWRISRESFFTDSKALSFVSDLKARISFAKTGNTNIGNYPFAGTFSAATYGVQSGLAYGQVGNSALKFETTDKYDAGLDISFLNNRINVTTDYFENKDNNLILAAPTAPSLGVPNNAINENVGTMVNKGFELAVNSVNIRKKDFSWTTDFNVTFVKNKITTLANNNSDITYTYNINRVGSSVGSIYGYQYAGVNAANGNPLYVKANGQVIQGNIANQTYYNYDPANPTALTTANTLSATTDRKILGNSLPTYYGGFNNTVTYKGIDLSIYFTYSGGNKIMNVTRQESLLNQKFQNNGTEILDRWTTVGQITDVPKLYYGRDNFTNLTGIGSSRFVEDGKFVRAQNIILGYSLPKTIINRLKLTRVRVYAEVQNAFVLTKYKGLDPELTTNNYTTNTNSQLGVDYNTNPKARTYTVGINVGF
ncbi:MAG: SusC/RagA family TonB-linked outer membrane protein [Janthinobacterium lividum]